MTLRCSSCGRFVAEVDVVEVTFEWSRIWPGMKSTTGPYHPWPADPMVPCGPVRQVA